MAFIPASHARKITKEKEDSIYDSIEHAINKKIEECSEKNLTEFYFDFCKDATLKIRDRIVKNLQDSGYRVLNDGDPNAGIIQSMNINWEDESE